MNVNKNETNMAKGLLDFYKEHVLIDPEVSDEEIGRILEITNKFNSLDFMYHIFQSFSDLQNYMGYRTNGYPEYFKSVSGNKVVKVGEYMGIIDLWYPRETCLFDLTRNPIMAGWVVKDLMDRMCGTQDITELLKLADPKKMVEESVGRLAKEIEGSEFYGFWMPDARNSARKKPIKIRRFEVMEVVTKEKGRTHYYYSEFPDLKMMDKDTKETYYFNQYNLDGWNFYLSKELLAERLKDLESFWMRGYDDRVRSLDYEVKVKRKELENLINRRSEFENGITEYKNKLHNILWKSF